MQDEPDRTQEPAHAPRAVRSYVMRAGRITAAQERALRELWPSYGIDYAAAPIDLPATFGRNAPRVVEIGFGNGEHLIERARAEPERDFLGIEVHRPGVGHLLWSAHREGLRNLRVISHDAVDVLTQQIAPGSLEEIELLFPDPWPKKRHHKRRLVQPGFAELVASRLRAGGVWHLATDWEPYAEHMLETLGRCTLLVNCAGTGFAPARSRRATRFERRGERLGHQVRELLFRRR